MAQSKLVGGWLRPRTLTMTVLAAALALGWAMRERAFAREKADLVQSQTVTLEQVKTEDVSFRDEVVGQVGFYVQGDTPASTQFVTGRFTLRPGKTNHLPHTHVEEEVLIIESGHGEIFCEGKTTPVGPGSVMYTTPNVAARDHRLERGPADVLLHQVGRQRLSVNLSRSEAKPDSGPLALPESGPECLSRPSGIIAGAGSNPLRLLPSSLFPLPSSLCPLESAFPSSSRRPADCACRMAGPTRSCPPENPPLVIWNPEAIPAPRRSSASRCAWAACRSPRGSSSRRWRATRAWRSGWRCASCGGLGLATTDLVNARSILERRPRSFELAETCPDDRPIAIQIYGTRHRRDARGGPLGRRPRGLGGGHQHGLPGQQGGQDRRRLGPDVPGRLGRRGWSRRWSDAVDVPVTVKMRLGWDDDNLTAPALARAVRAGRAWPG